MKGGRTKRTKEGGSPLAPRKWTGRKEEIGIEKGERECIQTGRQAGSEGRTRRRNMPEWKGGGKGGGGEREKGKMHASRQEGIKGRKEAKGKFIKESETGSRKNWEWGYHGVVWGDFSRTKCVHD